METETVLGDLFGDADEDGCKTEAGEAVEETFEETYERDNED